MRRLRFFDTAIATLAVSHLTFALNPIVKFNGTEWDDDNWTLLTRKFIPGQFESRISLANGYFGLNLASVGPFFEVDIEGKGDGLEGWPIFNRRQTFGTISGFYGNLDRAEGTNYEWLYQYGGESFISGVPHWAGLLVEAEGYVLNSTVNPEHIEGFVSTLDVDAGIMRWEYQWRPGGTKQPIRVEYSMFVHKLHVNQATVRVGLTAKRDVDVWVYDVLDGAGAVRTDWVGKGNENNTNTIWTAVSASGLPNVTAYIYSTISGDESVDWASRKPVVVSEGVFYRENASSIAQGVQVCLRAGKTAVVEKFVGAASSDAFSNPRDTARNASLTGALEGFGTLLESHKKEWKTILPRHSVDRYHGPDGTLPADRNIQQLQILSVLNPFMILQNTVGPNAIAAAGNNTRLKVHSVPVCGLGSECYGGLIFWDAEAWIAPGLQLSHPEHIETVVNYRVEKHAQAKENVKMAFTSSKNQTGRFTGGAVYPWTSARYGNCTGTGPCFDYEYHLNGDIAIALRNQYVVSGDAKRFRDEFLPICNDIAYFFGEVLDFNTTSAAYELWNATDPDEYANNVNQAGFTTALIQAHLNETNEFNTMFGLPENETWKEITTKMRLPINDDVGIVLEYGTMNGSIKVKQADVVLIDDILHYENPYSLANLDYYANKQSSDGPGMTYAAFSIVANERSPSGCSSYTYDIYSEQPYIRLPWYQFSEQMSDDYFTNGGTHPAFPFLTGMGGTNRIGVFGYLGIRLFADRLDIDPSLPPQIENLDYRTFYWQGYGINATSNSTHTTLRRMPSYMLSTANPAYQNNPIPVTLGTRPGKFQLSINTPLVVTNRMMGQTPTLLGNILQCKKVLPTNERYIPGQLPIAAIDGASSTKWQPYNASSIHYLTVDLGADTPFWPLKEVLMDWGSTPPQYYEILFTNNSLPPFSTSALSTNTSVGRSKDGELLNVTHGYVRISEPYDPDSVYAIQPIKGNQTNVTVPRDVDGGFVWSGRFAHLGIRGNLWNESGDEGGTVAEWNIRRWEDWELKELMRDDRNEEDEEEDEDEDDDDEGVTEYAVQ